MAFRTLASKGVDQAFRLAGDLLVDVSFINRTAGDYNFADGSIDVSDDTAITIKGLITKSSKLQAERTILELNILFKKDDITDITIYDNITIDSDNWKLYTFEDDGYVVSAVLRSEV